MGRTFRQVGLASLIATLQPAQQREVNGNN
jgi:hypothetical protein